MDKTNISKLIDFYNNLKEEGWIKPKGYNLAPRGGGPRVREVSKQEIEKILIKPKGYDLAPRGSGPCVGEAIKREIDKKKRWLL